MAFYPPCLTPISRPRWSLARRKPAISDCVPTTAQTSTSSFKTTTVPCRPLRTSLCVFHTIQPGTLIEPDTEQNEQAEKEPTDDTFAANRNAKTTNEQSTERDIRFLQETETLGLEGDVDIAESDNAKQMQEFFEQTVERQPVGRYSASLPFKENIRSLGSDEKLAFKRLSSLLDKTKRNPSLLAAIDREMMNYLKQGFIELAEPKQENQLAHYLPVQAVVKINGEITKGIINEDVESSKVKVRIVKGAGARSKDKASLNDVLHTGPIMLPDIINVIMRDRRNKISINSDLEKAFLQSRMNTSCRTFGRLFWPMNNISQQPDAPIREFWSKRLDFGLVCSSYLHCTTVRHHLIKVESELHPERSTFLADLADTFYMDDLILRVVQQIRQNRAAKKSYAC